MALLTLYVHVCAVQREGSPIVIKGDAIPTDRHMAGGTIRAKTTVVGIVLAVAGVTVRWRPLEDTVLMTCLARYLGMSALQLEGRQVMIELRVLPAIRCVADATIGSEASLVRIIVMVAGIAIFLRHFKIHKLVHIDVTFHASNTHMLPRQLERKGIMIKGFSKPVDPIMAVQAGPAERGEMGISKDRIHLTVAGLAGVRCESRDVLLVAVGADEWFVPSFVLVSLQGKSQQFVREFPGLHHDQRRIRTAVLGMATAALQLGIPPVHDAMQRDNVSHLDSDLTVTIYA